MTRASQSRASQYTAEQNLQAFIKGKDLIELFADYARAIGDPVCSQTNGAEFLILSHIKAIITSQPMGLLGPAIGTPPNSSSSVVLQYTYTPQGKTPVVINIPVKNRSKKPLSELTQIELEAVMFDTYRPLMSGLKIQRALRY